MVHGEWWAIADDNDAGDDGDVGEQRKSWEVVGGRGEERERGSRQRKEVGGQHRRARRAQVGEAGRKAKAFDPVSPSWMRIVVGIDST